MRRWQPGYPHPGQCHKISSERQLTSLPAVERQLGYKMAKYGMVVELVESFAGIEGGHGGYWEDHGYEWYAGI